MVESGFNLCPSFVIEKEEKNPIIVFSRDSQQKASTFKLVKIEKEGIENYSQGGQAEDTALKKNGGCFHPGSRREQECED